VDKLLEINLKTININNNITNPNISNKHGIISNLTKKSQNKNNNNINLKSSHKNVDYFKISSKTYGNKITKMKKNKLIMISQCNKLYSMIC